jgi:hypothetical protein
MATRSIISVWGSEGYEIEPNIKVTSTHEWFGRYCHWDGYPEHMIPALQAIIAQFGVTETKRRIMSTSWSSIGTDPVDMGIGKLNPERDPFLIAGGDDWGTEYRYVITDKGSILAYTSEGTFVTQVEATDKWFAESTA